VERQTAKPLAPAPQSFAVAPLDSYALRMTTGLAYLGGLLMLPLLFAYLANLRWDGLLIPVALAVAVAGFLLLTYIAQPRLYELTADELIVRRRLWRALRVPLNLVSGVSLATALSDVPVRQVRFAFNAGIFGYQGPFRLAPYGEVFFLATNRARLVAVARYGRTSLILSPDGPRAFVEALNERRTQRAIERLGHEGLTSDALPPSRPA
jgi:hypothetical protein